MITAPTPAPTETYTYYIDNFVNVNTTTSTETTTNTLTNEFRPGVNTSTNTNTTTNTLTKYNQLVTTNTSTSTSTNTSTNTATNTTTTTQTYIDGEGNPTGDGSGTLGNAEIEITLGGGVYGGTDGSGNVDGINNNPGLDMPLFVLEYDILNDQYDAEGQYLGAGGKVGGLEIEIEQTYDMDLDRVFGNGNAETGYLDDDPTDQGGKAIELDFVQTQDIVQDITVEVELIQDFTQVQEIQQTINQPIAATGTRLKSE